MNLSNKTCINGTTVPGLGPHVKHAILDFHDFLQEFILVCIYTHTAFLYMQTETTRLPFPNHFPSCHAWVYFSRLGLFRKTVYFEGFSVPRAGHVTPF